MGFGKDGKGVMIKERVTITLGTLGAGLALSGGAFVLQDDFRIIKTEYLAVLTGGTAGDGPYLLVLTDAELQDVEISQAALAGPSDRNDNVENERTNRPVFNMGYFNGIATSGQVGQSDGRLTEKTIRWTFSDPEGWEWAIVNLNTGALTTGAFVSIFAKHYGVWVT